VFSKPQSEFSLPAEVVNQFFPLPKTEKWGKMLEEHSPSQNMFRPRNQRSGMGWYGMGWYGMVLYGMGWRGKKRRPFWKSIRSEKSLLFAAPPTNFG